MLIKYQNKLFKLPKFNELDYLSDERKNEFIYVLLYYYYEYVSSKLNKRKFDSLYNSTDIEDFTKLTNSKKEELLLKTYNNIFYGIGDFQSKLKTKTHTILIQNNSYMENLD